MEQLDVFYYLIGPFKNYYRSKIMSAFEVPIKKVNIKEHPNADRLEIAHIQGTQYQSLVGIDEYESGDLVAYIPEDAIVPKWVQEKLGVKGKLAGPDKNRVRSVRLRGVYSQGLCFPVQNVEDHEFFDNGYYIFRPKRANKEQFEKSDKSYSVKPKYKKVEVGDDVKDFFGIEKYEPPIPVHMSGEVYNSRGNTIKYDIENYKKYPDVIENGEEVVVGEKIHGSWCCIGVVPKEEASDAAGRFIITSKGLSSKGQALKLNEKNEDNVYIRAARKHDLLEQLLSEKKGYFYILGEVFGKKVQDLEYGAEKNDIYFRVFDIYEGEPRRGPRGGDFLSDHRLEEEIENFGLERVPVLYRGEFSERLIEELVDGHETVSGNREHIREGVVVRPIEERSVNENLPMGGRVQLKWKSQDYLLRNDGSERR